MDSFGSRIPYKHIGITSCLFALKCFCSHMNNCHIQIQIDNTTALAYINNMGGSKSKELNQLAVQIWEWCISRNIWLSAVQIPGRLNTGADEKSRVFSDNHEWMLNKHSFDKILLRFPGLHTIRENIEIYKIHKEFGIKFPENLNMN